MPLVVTDSTCLIGLERIGHLDLLPNVFPEITAPPAVMEEFGREPDWLAVRRVAEFRLVAVLQTQLGRGESEAIALATELNQGLILLDDRKARYIARQLELRTVGTLGVLLRAKQQGLIGQIQPILKALIESGFHLSHTLYEEALRLAGETD